MKKIIALILLLCLSISLAACGESKVDDKTQFNEPKKGDTVATIKTNYGDIKVLLFPQVAPKAVENFTKHAENGYYDGIIFHRVIDGFMIQGGDPTGTGAGGESIWGEPFEDEFSQFLHNVRGSLSMANAGPKTNGSQFFIVQMEDATYLDGSHTVFGQVLEDGSMKNVDKIAEVEVDDGDKPIKDVIIETIEISKIK